MTEKEAVREPRRVASPKEEKTETKGKEKVKGRKGNVSRKSQNLQKSSGQVDLGNYGQINLGMLKQTLRVGGKIGTQQIQILKHQQPLRNFNMLLSVNCDFQTHLIFSACMQNCCSCQSPCYTRIFDAQRFSTWRCAYSTAGRDKVYDQGKRILCTLDGTGKPMVIESRKVNCRRPLMAVTEMTDCGRHVILFMLLHHLRLLPPVGSCGRLVSSWFAWVFRFAVDFLSSWV